MADETKNNQERLKRILDLSNKYERGELDLSSVSKSDLEEVIKYQGSLLANGVEVDLDVLDAFTKELCEREKVTVTKDHIMSRLCIQLVLAVVLTAAIACATSAVSYAIGLNWYGTNFEKEGWILNIYLEQESEEPTGETEGEAEESETPTESEPVAEDTLPDKPGWVPEGFVLQSQLEQADICFSTKEYTYVKDDQKLEINVVTGAGNMTGFSYAKDETLDTYDYNGVRHFINENVNWTQWMWQYGQKVYTITTTLSREEMERIVRSYYRTAEVENEESS